MMDAGERALLETTVRDAIASASSADAALAELGWLDMLAAERDDAIAIVFEALGAANANATALDDVVVSALGLGPGPERAAAFSGFGRRLATARVTTANELLVGRAFVPISTVSVEAMSGIDPDAGIHVVAVEETPAPKAVAHGRRAVAHQIAGATRTMVELARQHAVDRVQFGRPIARFQAVRHRLAEALVAVEALDATLAAAASDPSDTTAALAKITAGQTARTVAAHCQQVLAGVGFTTDHPFHRYLKRTLLLDGLFGRADEIVVALGHELLAARAVPTLIDL
jgi:alkylation response protein AidB-like acyl-CoA dehydrogenase